LPLSRQNSVQTRGSDKREEGVDKTHMEVQDLDIYQMLCKLHKECIRMLNGLEKSLEKRLPESDRKWPAGLLSESLNTVGHSGRNRLACQGRS
jgi:hypothetical protein